MFANDLYSIKWIKLEKLSQHINVFNRNIEFTMEEKKQWKIAIPDILSKRKNGIF